ncbi:MAG: ATP-binding cassette domain-containing protein [Desulfobacterales bacterium]|nr:ATP-binding cassette domain-containing protein [Desulfobacterales bacterium]
MKRKGANGAGKTTTIEVIEDITPPTSGEILYKGMPRSASFREEVGTQFQHTALLNFLTVRETLETFHRLFHHMNGPGWGQALIFDFEPIIIIIIINQGLSLSGPRL